MNVIAALGGVLIIAVILWEVFNDLFRPSGRGALSDWIGRGLFTLFKKKHALLPISGPLALIIVIVVWCVALALGFALIYIAAYPDGFRTSTGALPPMATRFSSALYFSSAMLSTLGYGDLDPQTLVIRVLSTLEAFIGFGILTASVSSIVLIYPALSRMRTLALGMSHIAAAEDRNGLTPASSGSHEILAALASQVTQARIDFVHFPVIYYFATRNGNASVAKWTKTLRRFAAEGADLANSDQVRIAASVLGQSLDDLAELLAIRYLDMSPDDADRVFEAFAEDHGVEQHR